MHNTRNPKVPGRYYYKLCDSDSNGILNNDDNSKVYNHFVVIEQGKKSTRITSLKSGCELLQMHIQKWAIHTLLHMSNKIEHFKMLHNCICQLRNLKKKWVCVCSVGLCIITRPKFITDGCTWMILRITWSCYHSSLTRLACAALVPYARQHLNFFCWVISTLGYT